MSSTTQPIVLTERQEKILGLIECGFDSEEIEDRLHLNKWTCREQIRKLRLKFRVGTMPELPAAARAAGFTFPTCD